MNTVERIERMPFVQLAKRFFMANILFSSAWWPDWTMATPPTEYVNVSLFSDANGELASAQIETSKPITGTDTIARLQRHLAAIFQNARDAGQPEPEIHLRIDDKLRFQEVVKGIHAVSKLTNSNGTEVTLATTVRMQTQDFRVGVHQEYLKYLQRRGKERLKLGLDTP